MPSALHLVPRRQYPVLGRPGPMPAGTSCMGGAVWNGYKCVPARPARDVVHTGCAGCQATTHTGALPVSGPSLLVVLGVLALGGGAGAWAFASHKVIGALAGSIAGIALLGLYEKLFAATAKPAAPAQQPLLVLIPTTCPDGTLAPNGSLAACASPKMGPNDPDSPPGGWVYNAPVASTQTVQQAAAALAAVNPCLQSSEQLVRNFQAAAGLAQLNAAGDWNAVSPPGTDGRYGGDCAIAMKQYVTNPPPACYSNANPNNRPAWWGPAGTFTNGGGGVSPAAAVAAASSQPAAGAAGA